MFGDNWEHLVVLDAILPWDRDGQYPDSIKNVGTCPEEDSGGPFNYQSDRREDDDDDSDPPF